MKLIKKDISNERRMFVMTGWTPEGQADQTPKSLGMRIIRRLRETFVVNENEVIIVLGASGVNL